jgi:hypothetical protein
MSDAINTAQGMSEQTKKIVSVVSMFEPKEMKKLADKTRKEIIEKINAAVPELDIQFVYAESLDAKVIGDKLVFYESFSIPVKVEIPIPNKNL